MLVDYCFGLLGVVLFVFKFWLFCILSWLYLDGFGCLLFCLRALWGGFVLFCWFYLIGFFCFLRCFSVYLCICFVAWICIYCVFVLRFWVFWIIVELFILMLRLNFWSLLLWLTFDGLCCLVWLLVLWGISFVESWG